MRAKHHYTIIVITHHYKGDYFEFGDGHTKTEKVVYETNKRFKAEQFYNDHLYLEQGSIYKGIYYPYKEIVFRRDF